jgi:hypothetical protein
MSEINNQLIKQVLGIETDQEIRCDSVGLIIDHEKQNMLSFLDDQKFLADLKSSPNISKGCPDSSNGKDCSKCFRRNA